MGQVLVERVVGADQKGRADRRQLVARCEHQLAHAAPVAAMDACHVVGERMRVHRHFGMRVRAKQRSTFGADRSIAKRGTLGRAGNNADLRWHQPAGKSQSWAGFSTNTLWRADSSGTHTTARLRRCGSSVFIPFLPLVYMGATTHCSGSLSSSKR